MFDSLLHRCANKQKIISTQVDFQTQISRDKLNSERIINIRDYSSEFDRCFFIIFEVKMNSNKIKYLSSGHTNMP